MRENKKQVNSCSLTNTHAVGGAVVVVSCVEHFSDLQQLALPQSRTSRPPQQIVQ